MAVTASARVSAPLRARFELRQEVVVGVLVGVAVLYLVAAPLFVLAFSSLRDTRDKLPFENTAFTFANYVNVFTAPSTYSLLGNTLGYALGATVLGLGLGSLFAWFLHRAVVPMRTFLMVCVLAALGTPPVTDALAWALLANPSNGVLNQYLQALFGIGGPGPINIYSVAGMILVSGLKSVPSAFILIAGPIARFDPALEEAALMSGASGWTTGRRIVMPLLRPALLGGAILYLIVILEAFEVAAVLGFPSRIFVFATLIYDATHPPAGLPNYGMISAYAAVFVAAAMLLLWVYHRATRRAERFVVVTGKGYRPRLANLGLLTYPLVGLILLYFLLAVVLPFVALIWTSLGLLYEQPSIRSLALASFDQYALLFQSPRLVRTATNTAIIAITAATGTMLLAAGVAWLSIRQKGWVAVAPDRLLMLNFATPAIVTGLALSIFYAWLPLPIYGTIWIIVIALSTRFLPYATRVMAGAYVQIHRELEEVAALSGADLFSTVRRIILPLVWPSFSGGWLWVFVNSLRDTAVSIMLLAVTNDTVGAQLWMYWFSEGKPAQAAALAVCLAIVSVLLSLGIIRTAMRQQPG